ncbi:MAG: dihydroorotate dehydrogenase electron transfer subunit [Sedimenticola sp.]|nr:dihydroorotate dehydrogenase electron transfer subunit [Sedimenticola sp.]MCW8949536.1 dihydroorotate dehydrogenase electron transfer subunit [Sedimenticola sp.]MCW8974965.1 dihydroorotate dehydrogenase electron transfer subunit [Sedimenticola sp.]MDF1528342.1 dihydroorotate dehydrogenase electron transfer subunit [Sedimenticola sp.]
MTRNKSHRGTIFMEEAEILSHQAFEGEQFILRVRAPECAEKALPGSFVHIQCDRSKPLRRPISIMRVSAKAGWVDFLYKAVGEGTRLLSKRKPGEFLSMLGPIGVPFKLNPERPRPLLIGGGVGMPPMIFIAETVANNKIYKPMVILGSEVPFPFKPHPSSILIPEMPEGVIASMPLMDDWHIPSRLASLQGFPGCFEGYVTDLARHWLNALPAEARAEVEIFSCGPHPMLEGVAKLAAEFDLPCQVSLEEFMACGVGGCAGCVVEVETDTGPAMKRVCVDGPVFDSRAVFSS